jgi:hypothetical protein
VNDLREDMDRALRAVTFGEAPVERAKQSGRRIRTRRRVALLAGALAVAAVAAGYPALARNSAAPPAPATGTKSPAPHGRPYGGDPVITDSGPGGTVQAAGGLASSSGAIAKGTMGGVPWQVTVRGPGAANPVPADSCFKVSLTTAGDLGGSCADFPVLKAGLPDSGEPVMFTDISDSVTEATIGEAASVVTYVIVNFTDGQHLKLIPVTAHGHRYVAWVAPVSMTIGSVVAHLGGPYSDSGQTATAIPFDQPGQLPVFGAWQQPGQRVPARASGVVGGGLLGGHAIWSAIAYVGPWGSCVVVNGPGFVCIPFGPASTMTIVGPLSGSVPGLRVIIGSAPAGVAKVRVALSGGKTVTARPVAVGNARLFAVAVPANAGPARWTSYDAAGQQNGTGSVASVSSAAPKGAKP